MNEDQPMNDHKLHIDACAVCCNVRPDVSGDDFDAEVFCEICGQISPTQRGTRNAINWWNAKQKNLLIINPQSLRRYYTGFLDPTGASKCMLPEDDKFLRTLGGITSDPKFTHRDAIKFILEYEGKTIEEIAGIVGESEPHSYERRRDI